MKKELPRFQLGLLAIATLVLLAHCWFLALDEAAPIYDEQAVAHQSQLLAKGLRDDPQLLRSFAWRAGPASYPPLIHLTSLPVTFLGFQSLNVPRWSFLGYWILLLAATAWLGREIAGPKAGLTAAVFTAMVPGLYGFSHIYLVDFPLAVWTTCILALLVASRNFSRFRTTSLFSLSLAAGLLTKPTVLLYVGPPIACYLGLALIGNPDTTKRKQIVIRFSLAFLLGLILALPWYFSGGLDYYAHRLNIETFGRQTNPGGWRLILYFGLLWRYGLGPVLCLLTLLGTLLTTKNRTYAVLMVAVLVPFLMIGPTLGAVFTRYLLPLLPPAAILAATGLARLPSKNSTWMFLGTGLALIGLIFQIQAQPVGPLTERAAHDRFQKVGALRPQKEDTLAQEITKSIITAGLAEKTIILLDSPLTERIQSEIWQQQIGAWVFNWFESASLGFIPDDMDEPAEIEYKLEQALAILACDFNPKDVTSYAPGGNTPMPYTDLVFAAFKKKKPNLKLLKSWPLPSNDHMLRLWTNVDMAVDSIDPMIN